MQVPEHVGHYLLVYQPLPVATGLAVHLTQLSATHALAHSAALIYAEPRR